MNAPDPQIPAPIREDGPPHPNQRRLDRWRRPIATRWDRFRAWANMMLVDHAFFRVAYLNMHRLSDKAWRSAQPLPYQIHAMKRRGIRTVVSLRGGQSFGSYPLEIEACRTAGIGFTVFEMRSRAVPTPEQVEKMVTFFDELEYPVLFHCKSGADRAGMMSALYLVLHEGVPVSEARRQLSLRYGHVRHGKTGILDAFFDAYEADQPDGQLSLLEWVRTRYDAKALTKAFTSGKIGNFLTETVLRRE